MAKIKLIADSGATKTAWCLLADNKRRSFFTKGISPYHMDQVQITDLVAAEFPSKILKSGIDEIHYYGTGCYTVPKANVVKKALGKHFKDAAIHVTHDLMGAAIALCGNEKGIACILGTGSNSCFFNGKKIVHNSPGLGYVLGDEGSGAYLGKKVIQYFLYGTFDKFLHEKFLQTYNTDKAEILHKVYKEPFANRYLAEFSRFLSAHRGHYMIENIIEDGLRDFFEQHLNSYAQRNEVPVHFVGSIAYYFRDKIAELCAVYGLRKGSIIRQPMSGLVDFHRKN